VSETNPKVVRIFRIGNGKAVANPSPALFRPGEQFVMKNWTECPAEVSFAEAPITPKSATIGTRSAHALFTVDSQSAPGYYEYVITLQCTHGDRRVQQYVEGGSRPGVIVDA
jgi:hypothetical protein